MGKFSLLRDAEAAAIRAAIAWLDKDPVNRLLKLIQLLQSADSNGTLKKQLDDMKLELEKQEGVVYELITGIFAEVDASVRTRLIENFLLNAIHVGSSKQDEVMARFQKKIPWLLYSDPYKPEQELLSNAEVSAATTAGKNAGIGLFVFPDMRWGERLTDIFRIAETNTDLLFAVCVKPEVVSDQVIDQVMKVKNMVLILQGEEGETYDRAVSLLQTRKAPFGTAVISSAVEELERIMAEKVRQKIRQVVFLSEEPLNGEALQKLDTWANAYRETHPVMTVGLWKKEDGSLYLPLGVGAHPEVCLAVLPEDLN